MRSWASDGFAFGWLGVEQLGELGGREFYRAFAESVPLPHSLSPTLLSSEGAFIHTHRSDAFPRGNRAATLKCYVAVSRAAALVFIGNGPYVSALNHRFSYRTVLSTWSRNRSQTSCHLSLTSLSAAKEGISPDVAETCTGRSLVKLGMTYWGSVSGPS